MARSSASSPLPLSEKRMRAARKSGRKSSARLVDRSGHAQLSDAVLAEVVDHLVELAQIDGRVRVGQRFKAGIGEAVEGADHNAITRRLGVFRHEARELSASCNNADGFAHNPCPVP